MRSFHKINMGGTYSTNFWSSLYDQGTPELVRWVQEAGNMFLAQIRVLRNEPPRPQKIDQSEPKFCHNETFRWSTDLLPALRSMKPYVPDNFQPSRPRPEWIYGSKHLFFRFFSDKKTSLVARADGEPSQGRFFFWSKIRRSARGGRASGGTNSNPSKQ